MKELKKKKKREEKLEKKRLKKLGATPGDPEQNGVEQAEAPDDAVESDGATSETDRAKPDDSTGEDGGR
jgi:hypothetical protein